MEAIENILRLIKAETIEEMDSAMMASHDAVNDLHLEKLQRLESEVTHRLGVRSMASSQGGPMEARNDEIPRRRLVRDDPQA